MTAARQIESALSQDPANPANLPRMAAVQHQSEGARQILEAAARLFAKKGYEATSTREIVEAAGVTKPMLYYYFGSKEGLCKAALASFADGFFEHLREAAERPLPPREALVEFVWAHFDQFREHVDIARLYFSLYFGSERHTFAGHIEQLSRKGDEIGRDFVARIAASGLLRGGCEEDFFMALHGMIEAWHMRSMTEDAELSRDLAERIVEGLLHGYAA
ncbi:MAG: TetR/AcrR family transcriptional regulator [Planctomycetota bacterium]